jgi:uncharacterized lipoprotein YajG
MKYLIIIAALFLTACDVKERTVDNPPPKPNWQNAATEYKCTADQMTKVQAEHVFCKENTSYFTSYCYNSAIIRNCAKIVGDTK